MKTKRPYSSKRFGWFLALASLAAAPSPAVAQLVRGQVVDSISGEPVSQSTVILAGPNGEEADRTVSDARGFYLLRAPRPGRYQLIVEHEAYRRSSFPPFDLASEMRSFVLQVSPLAAALVRADPLTNELAAELCENRTEEGLRSIVGIVRDAVSGSPVPGARIHFPIPSEPTDVNTNQAGTVTTNDRGAYAVCRAPIMMRIAVHAVADDRMSSFEAVLFGTGGVFQRGTFQSMTGSVWRQDLELFPPEQRDAALTGTVTDTSGAAVSGAIVEIVGTPLQTRTDGMGRFEFSNLTHGELRVQAKQVGYAPAEFDLELTEGQTVDVAREMLVLGRFPTRLRDIIVTGEAARYGDARLDGFFHRRETSQGKFATRDDWQKWTHFRLSDILDRTRYTLEKIDTCLQPSTAYVDGMYLPPGSSLEAFMDLDKLVAIEAYGNGMNAPREYRRHRCGSVILFWTTR